MLWGSRNGALRFATRYIIVLLVTALPVICQVGSLVELMPSQFGFFCLETTVLFRAVSLAALEWCGWVRTLGEKICLIHLIIRLLEGKT